MRRLLCLSSVATLSVILPLPTISLALSTPASSITVPPFVSSDLAAIRLGGVCVLNDWISKEEVEALRNGVRALREKGDFFQPSGLSNRVRGDQNEFGAADRLTFTIAGNDAGLPDYEARRPIEQRLERLRQELEQRLGCDALELAEQYYSISPRGSSLPRHMDERHEDTKGEKGWSGAESTRRSVSWLLYLNQDDWNAAGENGGELRLFCRRTTSMARCGANQGDIQVGWLPTTNAAGSDETNSTYDPVYLDSWVKTRGEEVWEARAALYRLDDQATPSATTATARDYLSAPFGPDSPRWPSDPNLEPHQFAAALGQQLRDESHRHSFLGVEEVQGAEIVDVDPRGGSLVLFDSATWPHEVLETKQGERLAMAGWFHEPIQDFPDWYGHDVDDDVFDP